MLNLFKDIYNYRTLLKTTIKKDIRGKYKGSFLGFIWAFLNPLLMLLVYATIFPYLLRGASEKNYTMFLFPAILAWNFFSATIMQGASTIIQNGNIIKKVYFPREILPIAVVTGGVINFLISLLILVVALVFTGVGFSQYIIYLPLVILTQYLIVLGLTFIISAITVYFRDLEYVINVILLVWMYASAIFYRPELILNSNAPQLIKTIFNLNPIVHIVSAYRDCLYDQSMPNIKALLIILLISTIICVLGYGLFRKLERRFAEEL